MNYQYQNELIGLRPLSLNDLEGNYPNWFTDMNVCQFNSHGVFHKSIRQLKHYIESLDDDCSKIVWAIDELSSNKHIGNISLSAIDYINRSAEYAILMGEKQCWGKGYAKGASHFVLEHGFKKLNLNRIYCGTTENNLAMQALAESMGMTQEGRLKQSVFLEGQYRDVLLYGLING